MILSSSACGYSLLCFVCNLLGSWVLCVCYDFILINEFMSG